MPEPQKLVVPPGMIAVTTWGAVTVETCAAVTELRGFCERAGLRDVLWTFVAGGLIDKTRNEAVRQMLGQRLQNAPLGWIVFLDADATFEPTVLDRLLTTAFQTTPWVDIIGAWCPLRGTPFLPTIDRGSGTWEPHDVGCGVVEVIRTGSHCILIKRHVYEKMPFPWYGVRPAPRAIDVIAEFDNYARQKFDGTNPFRDSPAWAALERCATEDAVRLRAQLPQGHGADFMSAVGEDSNFCDKARALGFRIAVNTDIVTGHVDRKVITYEDHRAAMEQIRRNQRLVHGVLS